MGNFESSTACAGTVRIIASDHTWMEGNAIRQLQQTAQLTGVEKAVGMPDLHAGKGCPIGAAFLVKNWLYPHLIGNDIGCGMGIWKTSLKASKLKLSKWESKLFLDEPWQGDTHAWLEQFSLPNTLFNRALGTIGGGNHFAELQAIESIHDAETTARLGFEKNQLHLLVHSGSRGLGQDILCHHVSHFGAKGLAAGSSQAKRYLEAHNQATQWAAANRALIAKRFLSSLRSDCEKLLDLHHNTVTPKQLNDTPYWLHRKGASPSDQGALVIPGSRGSFSYLVMPTGDQTDNAFSLAHGAGRKWNRSQTKARLSSKFREQDLTKTELGSLVICQNKSLIFEEAPQAYKKIDHIINDMVEAGLIRILAVLRPVLTYKTKRRPT